MIAEKLLTRKTAIDSKQRRLMNVPALAWEAQTAKMERIEEAARPEPSLGQLLGWPGDETTWRGGCF